MISVQFIYWQEQAKWYICISSKLFTDLSGCVNEKQPDDSGSVCHGDTWFEFSETIWMPSPRNTVRRSCWPCALRHGSEAAGWLGSRVRFPLRTWMFVFWVCYLGRSFCDELMTRSEESHWLWCLVVCDLETWRKRPWPALGSSATGKMCTYGLFEYLIIVFCQHTVLMYFVWFPE